MLKFLNLTACRARKKQGSKKLKKTFGFFALPAAADPEIF